MVSGQKGTDFSVPLVVVTPLSLCSRGRGVRAPRERGGRERRRRGGVMKSMPPPLPHLCSSAFVVLLLLLCRPLVANGRATPTGASPPSPEGPSAAQPALQPAPAANGAAAVLPAAAGPPPLGRLECWIKTLRCFLRGFSVFFCSDVPGFLMITAWPRVVLQNCAFWPGICSCFSGENI